jgi:Lon protease-like protein
MLQALHIFEPRYRQMVSDALEDDRLIAPVLLRPGWEGHYQGNPAVHGIACVGKIIADQRLEGGKYYLQLRGLSRVRIVREIPTDRLYRTAQVELLPDVALPSETTEAALRRKLAERLPAWNTVQGTTQNVLLKVLKCDLPLGTVSDILSFALPLNVELKQELLEQFEVERRVRTLLRFLASRPAMASATGDRTFPPDFSSN